jgi:uncharacterized damage-inducible protein DinB
MSNELIRDLLDAKLREVEQRFGREMRARGFDPAQAENIPLTPALSKLYAEREQLRHELHALTPGNGSGDRMTETERIEDQLKRAFEGNAWHGPAVRELLKNVTAEQAAAHPVAGAHSIWEIALHIAAWEGVGRRRLAGDRAQLPAEENWSPVTDTSDEAWDQAKAALEKGHHELRRAILRLDEARLDEPILAELSSVYVTLHGVIQHDLYHAGQIAILKKALS